MQSFKAEEGGELTLLKQARATQNKSMESPSSSSPQQQQQPRRRRPITKNAGRGGQIRHTSIQARRPSDSVWRRIQAETLRRQRSDRAERQTRLRDVLTFD